MKSGFLWKVTPSIILKSFGIFILIKFSKLNEYHFHTIIRWNRIIFFSLYLNLLIKLCVLFLLPFRHTLFNSKSKGFIRTNRRSLENYHKFTLISICWNGERAVAAVAWALYCLNGGTWKLYSLYCPDLTSLWITVLILEKYQFIQGDFVNLIMRANTSLLWYCH